MILETLLFAIALTIVVILILLKALFNDYRQRNGGRGNGQQQVMIQKVETLHVTNQTLTPSTSQEKLNIAAGSNVENLPESDHAGKDSEKVTEDPIKTIEKALHGNEEAPTVRHRHARRTISEQQPERDVNEDRVFSGWTWSEKSKHGMVEDKAQISTFDHPHSIDQTRHKTDRTECKPEAEDESPKQNLKAPTKVTSDLSDSESYETDYTTIDVNEPCQFIVSRDGLKVSSPYCRIDFPPGAVDKALKITMTPYYNVKAPSHKEVLITPFVYFETDRKEKFKKEITLWLKTGYACACDRKKILVKILRKSSLHSEWQHIENTALLNNSFISFSCKHFCGYCISAEENNYHNMSRRYWMAGYVRERKSSRIFHWKLFEDCPQLYDRKCKYLKEMEFSLTMDIESFTVAYDRTLQMKIEEGETSAGRQNFKDVSLTRMWGGNVDVSNQFKLENKSGRNNEELEVKYSIIAVHHRTDGPNMVVKNNHFYVLWTDPPVPMPRTIVVNDNATGVQINTSLPLENQNIQHQISVAESGYGSPSTTGRNLSESVCQDEQPCSSTSRQDSGVDGFNEVFETRPKASISQSPLNSISQPTSHSTPVREQRCSDSLLLNHSHTSNETSGIGSFRNGDLSATGSITHPTAQNALSFGATPEGISDILNPESLNASFDPTSINFANARPRDGLAGSDETSDSKPEPGMSRLDHPMSQDALINSENMQPGAFELHLAEDDEQVPSGVEEMHPIEPINERETSDPDSLDSLSSGVIVESSSSTCSIESGRSFSEESIKN